MQWESTFLFDTHLVGWCRQVDFDLAACMAPDVGYSSERLHATLEGLQVFLGRGSLAIQTTNLVATAARVSSQPLQTD